MTEIIIKSIGESDQAVVLGTIKWADQRLELATARDEEAKRELLRLLEQLSTKKQLLLRLPCTREETDKGTRFTSYGVSIPVDHPLYPWAVTENLDVLQFRLSDGKPIWGVIEGPVPTEFLPTPA